jgi:hypothetical protein
LRSEVERLLKGSGAMNYYRTDVVTGNVELKTFTKYDSASGEDVPVSLSRAQAVDLCNEWNEKSRAFCSSRWLYTLDPLHRRDD